MDRSCTVIEKKRKTCVMRIVSCLQPLFKPFRVDMSPRKTIILNFIMALLFLAFGLVLRATTSGTVVYSIRIDDKCSDSETCKIPLNIKKKMAGPVYVYLGYKNYFLNHRKAVKGIPYEQLTGHTISVADAQAVCTDKYKNEHLTNQYSWSNPALRLEPQEAMNPCGIYASLFPKCRLLS